MKKIRWYKRIRDLLIQHIISMGHTQATFFSNINMKPKSTLDESEGVVELGLVGKLQAPKWQKSFLGTCFLGF